MVPGLDLYEWIGGAYKDVYNVTLETETVVGIANLYKLHSPVDSSMNPRFFYMVGGNRFELDKDMEVAFAWCTTSKGENDFIRNLYCVSDLVIGDSSSSISKIISQSLTISQAYTQMDLPVADEDFDNLDAPPVVNTQEDNTQHEVTSPIKTPRRSTRLDTINTDLLGSPSENTRGFKVRKTPTKKIAKQRGTPMKHTKKRATEPRQSEEDDATVRTSNNHLTCLTITI